MQNGNPTRLFALQHPVIDYLRVAVFAVIIMITLFIVKKFSSRADTGYAELPRFGEAVSLADLE